MQHSKERKKPCDISYISCTALYYMGKISSLFIIWEKILALTKSSIPPPPPPFTQTTRPLIELFHTLELLHEVTRRYQPTRGPDNGRAKEADLVQARHVYPVGMMPLMSPSQLWPAPPVHTLYHDQFSPLPPSGYPPIHSGYVQLEKQQLIGPLLPLYGYQPECPSPVMHNQFFHRQRYQLQGACVGPRALNTSVEGLDNYARFTGCSRGQYLARGLYSCRRQEIPRGMCLIFLLLMASKLPLNF